MNFEEFAAKPLLAQAGIAVPPSQIARTPDELSIVKDRTVAPLATGASS